jgi:cytochrome P450
VAQAIEEIIDGTPMSGIEMRLVQPEGRANPYPIYKRLREEDPVHEAPMMGGWTLARHEHVSLIRDARFVQRGPGFAAGLEGYYEQAGAEAWGRIVTGFMLTMDPPDHTRLRSLVTKAFTPRAVEALRPRIRQIVEGLIDEMGKRHDVDLISEFAYPLPITVICELLGVGTDSDRFRPWSRAIAKAIDIDMPELMRAASLASEEMMEYFLPIIADRRKHPGDDLLSALIAAEDDGDKLSGDEVMANLVLLLFAGHETTVNLIGNGTLALMRNRGQWDRLRADPSLARHGVEELLRYDSPVQLTSRNAAVDIEIGGKTIKAGQHVVFLLGSANRDPDVFADPDELDLTRPDVRHLSFGGGIHFCVGAPLARLEGEIAFEALVGAFPNMRLANEELSWREMVVLHGVEALPLQL